VPIIKATTAKGFTDVGDEKPPALQEKCPPENLLKLQEGLWVGLNRKADP
jgi:hypothetical protein